MAARGFRHESQPSPAAYAANPLVSGDATAAFLHFSELAAPYDLHTLCRRPAAPGLAPDLAPAAAGSTGLISRAPPPGHTPFTWDSDAATPRGHTPFSWGAPQGHF
jgi:hypothetical protein